MNKLQGKLVAGLATVAFFGVLGSAQAQPAGAPPVMDTTPPPPMQMMATPTPMASDNMAGQLGFGVGVSAGASLIIPGAVINMKYWLSDVLAVMPTLQFKMFTGNGIDTNWALAPGALVLYCPWRTTSTRLSVGAGLGLMLAKWGAAGPPALGTQPTGNPPANTYIGITIPLYAGVEHFFTKWFSMGIALQNDFLSYGKQGDGWFMTVAVDNVNNRALQAVGFLFFYTD
jgi:hypothetical protein